MKNDIRFSGCHQYSVETEIHFYSPEPAAAPTIGGKPAAPVPLPGEFNAELDFEGEIDTDTAAVGDPFTAVLSRAITAKGLTLVPKGAVLHGRIARLDLSEGHHYLDLRFLYFDAVGRRIDIGDRENRFSVWNQGLSINSRIFGPFRGYGPRLRLTPGYSLFLNSRLAKTQ